MAEVPVGGVAGEPLLRRTITQREDEDVVAVSGQSAMAATGQILPSAHSEGFESRAQPDNNADSNDPGYSGSAVNPAGQKPQLEPTVPDGRG
ncbi:MAG: hypothetical protein ACRD08_07405, partial [Acidimicrobiales bacterium]